MRRGLSTEGNLRLKIDWASLIVGSKFTVFPWFNFVVEGNGARYASTKSEPALTFSFPDFFPARKGFRLLRYDRSPQFFYSTA